jgi:hypothetical protein
MEELTLEEIQGSIRSAFDSVNLVNEQVLLDRTDELVDSVDRNYRHLEIMLSKEWFADALTESERNSIDSAIQSGQSFVNQ